MSGRSLGYFPEDHRFESLRGKKRMKSSRVRQTMLNRSEWLQSKIDVYTAEGKPCDLFYRELAAIAQVMEAFEVQVKERVESEEAE